MTCCYPSGASEGWCERHQRDHAMLLGIRARDGTKAAPPARPASFRFQRL